jgi:hypothetical protein
VNNLRQLRDKVSLSLPSRANTYRYCLPAHSSLPLVRPPENNSTATDGGQVRPPMLCQVCTAPHNDEQVLTFAPYPPGLLNAMYINNRMVLDRRELRGRCVGYYSQLGRTGFGKLKLSLVARLNQHLPPLPICWPPSTPYFN